MNLANSTYQRNTNAFSVIQNDIASGKSKFFFEIEKKAFLTYKNFSRCDWTQLEAANERTKFG